MKFNELFGQTLTNIAVSKDNTEIIFTTSTNERYKLYHEQDCCESVVVEDVCGNIADLLNTPLTMAEEATSNNSDEPNSKYESITWTFYKLATINGYVTIRWCGSSNGYYSESVDFAKVN